MWLFFFYKKRNLLFCSLFVFICYLIHQVHFLATISSVGSKSRIVQVLDHSNVMEIMHVRSEHDKFINENGLLRGVLLANMARYRPDSENNFKCLKSGELIPFDNVNDDYCDCPDGSDEPSTTACVNGTFYCDTQYQVKPVSLNVVPSNRINDGICDCCDGSDEWSKDLKRQLLTQGSSTLIRVYASSCPNLCHEM